MTDEEKAKAAAMIAGWYWQPVEARNYRYRYAVRSITRYYECLPVAADAMRLILEYLRDQEIAADGTLSLLGKEVGGYAGWKTKDVWYQTSPSDNWEGAKCDKVRVYQTLCCPGESVDGDGPYTVEDGCAYAVTRTFYWNVEALPELPASSSGVNYTMQSVSRDSETGLFSCLIERRERVQQNIELYESSGDVFQTVSEEQHIGVKADAVAATGLAATAGGGTIVTRKLTKNDDCTSNVENTVTVENSQPGAVKEYQRTLRSSTVTTTDRNQPAPVTGAGLAVGETRRSERTPGGLYNNSTTVKTLEAAGKISAGCQRTVFEHEHEETQNQTTAPATDEAPVAGGGVITKKSSRQNDDGNWDVTTGTTVEQPVANAVKEYRKTLRGGTVTTVNRNQPAPVAGTGLAVGETRRSEVTPGGLYNNSVTEKTSEPAGTISTGCAQTIFEHEHSTTVNQVEAGPVDAAVAGGGVVNKTSSRQTDDGNWDVTDETTTELPVANAVKEYRKTLRGGTITTVDRNQSSPVSGSGLAVGEMRRSEKTPGGLYNNSTTVKTVEAAGDIGYSCARSGGTNVHTDSKTSNVANLPSIEVTSATNKVVKRTARQTEDGNWDVTDETTEFTEATSTATSTWATETSVTTVKRHSPGTTVQATMGEASADPDDNGALSTRVTEYSPIAVDSGWIKWDSKTVTQSGEFRYHHGVRIFKNQDQAWLNTAKPLGGSNVSISANVNRFGLFDGSIAYTDLYEWITSGGGGGSGGSTAGTATCYEVKTDATGRRWRRQVTMSTRSYHGTGNEGAEASDQANCFFYPGMHLPARTYGIAAPVPDPHWYPDVGA